MKKAKKKSDETPPNGAETTIAEETPKASKAPKPAYKPRIVRLRSSLPCTLSTDQIVEKAREVARLSGEKQTLEDKRKAANADFQGQIKQIDGRLTQLNGHIASGTEFRDIDCEWHYFKDGKKKDNGKKTLVRLDTGEVVRISETTDAERQEELALPL